MPRDDRSGAVATAADPSSLARPDAHAGSSVPAAHPWLRVQLASAHLLAYALGVLALVAYAQLAHRDLGPLLSLLWVWGVLLAAHIGLSLPRHRPLGLHAALFLTVAAGVVVVTVRGDAAGPLPVLLGAWLPAMLLHAAIVGNVAVRPRCRLAWVRGRARLVRAK